MIHISTKKLLLCLFSFFSYASCMEMIQLPSDAFTSIAGQLTLIDRYNLKNSCKALHKKLNQESLFLPLFDSKKYFKFISIQRNYLPLRQVVSAKTILKLKIFAARQKEDEEKMFVSLMEHCPESGCESPHCAINEPFLPDRIRVYAKEWQCNKVGNIDHFRWLRWIIEKSHSCRGYLDLVFAQGIDVNAFDPCYKTALCVTSACDEYAWATHKLIDHPLCNVNVTWGMHLTGALNNILFSFHPDANIKNLRILLTRADLNIEYLRGSVKNITESKAKNLLLTAYPFLDEQK